MELKCMFDLYGVSDYLCRVLAAQEIPGTIIKAFKGEHVDGMSNINVTKLRFGAELKCFPRDLSEHFPNLEVLEFPVDSFGINKISKRDLKGLENLIKLSVGFCGLTSLPDDLFDDMPNLKFVSFCGNKIESASSNLLKPLVGRSGVCVNLCGNKNISASYNSEDSEESTHKSLEELMVAIDEKCFKPKISKEVVEVEEFVEGINNLWYSRQFSDFKIISGSKEFKVHRNILAMRSLVMSEVFTKYGNLTKIEVDFINASNLEPLLQHIYGKDVCKNLPDRELYMADKFKIKKIESAYVEDITDLWTSGRFSDFKIISDDRKFNVHRNILAIRSSVMKEIFEDNGKSKEHEINDFTSIAVKSLLHFIYTNEIIHEDNAVENLAIANKFKVQKMKSACEKIISSKLNYSNAYEIFKFAHEHKAEDLREKAIKAISDKFPNPLPEKLMKDPAKVMKLIDNHLELMKLLE